MNRFNIIESWSIRLLSGCTSTRCGQVVPGQPLTHTASFCVHRFQNLLGKNESWLGRTPAMRYPRGRGSPGWTPNICAAGMQLISDQWTWKKYPKKSCTTTGMNKFRTPSSPQEFFCINSSWQSRIYYHWGVQFATGWSSCNSAGSYQLLVPRWKRWMGHCTDPDEHLSGRFSSNLTNQWFTIPSLYNPVSFSGLAIVNG